jgi:hypothetical protein
MDRTPARLTPPPVPTAAVRLSDGERTQLLDILQQHVGTGRLSLAEYDQRASIISTAATSDIAAQAFNGLPALGVSGSRSVSRLLLQIHTGTWAAASVVNLAVWGTVAVVDAAPYFWPIWVIVPWGALVGAHAVATSWIGRQRETRRSQRAIAKTVRGAR